MKKPKENLERECAEIEEQMFEEDLTKAYKQIGVIETPQISLNCEKVKGKSMFKQNLKQRAEPSKAIFNLFCLLFL